MPESVLLMLNGARANRERAERARWLAKHTLARDAVKNLLHYAAELEQLALEGERRACELAETIAHTQTLGAEIGSGDTSAAAARQRARQVARIAETLEPKDEPQKKLSVPLSKLAADKRFIERVAKFMDTEGLVEKLQAVLGRIPHNGVVP